MLKVRAVQLAVLDAACERRFESRLREHLRRHYAHVAELSAEESQLFVANAVKIARAHGLTWKRSIATFVSLMSAVSPRFFAAPPIARVLCDASRPPDSRMEKVLELTSKEAWQAAASPDIRQAIRNFANPAPP
jgi:hypothetical protein